MRFLIDESTGPSVARWLQSLGHDVVSVYDQCRGLDDYKILEKSLSENRILITNDKDFGEMVYRSGQHHCGLIMLRLVDERPTNKIAVLEKLLLSYQGQLPGQFFVVTEEKIRIVRQV